MQYAILYRELKFGRGFSHGTPEPLFPPAFSTNRVNERLAARFYAAIDKI